MMDTKLTLTDDDRFTLHGEPTGVLAEVMVAVDDVLPAAMVATLVEEFNAHIAAGRVDVAGTGDNYLDVVTVLAGQFSRHITDEIAAQLGLPVVPVTADVDRDAHAVTGVLGDPMTGGALGGYRVTIAHTVVPSTVPAEWAAAPRESED